jgi:hypothetical protein
MLPAVRIKEATRHTLTYRGRLCDPGLVRHLVLSQCNRRSVLPGARYPAEHVAVDRDMADGGEREVSGDQRLTVRG